MYQILEASSVDMLDVQLMESVCRVQILSEPILFTSQGLWK